MKSLRHTAAGAALLLLSGAASAQLTFDFRFLPGTSLQAQQAFIAAGNRWSSVLRDNVTLSVTVGLRDLDKGVLGETDATPAIIPYATYRNALVADASSGYDSVATAHLPTGNSHSMLINYTGDNPNGPGSPQPFVASMTDVRTTTANAKALGLPAQTIPVGWCGSACDGSVVFATGVQWDYDPSDGITPGSLDFVGLATHEIGHTLGFNSGVELLDTFSSSGAFPAALLQQFFTPLDLFRYSAASAAAGVTDYTAGIAAKYFSIDGGATALLGARFATGTLRGDGNKAGHWADGLGIGIMDPTAGPGELLALTAADVAAFDVIGWNVSAVPEPATYGLFGVGLATLAWRRRRMTGLAGNAIARRLASSWKNLRTLVLKRLRAAHVRQLFAATFLAGSACASYATEVTFQFSGVLTRITDFTGILGGQFAVGNSFSGTITYDFNSPEDPGSGPTPAGPNPNFGVYQTAFVHYTANINGFAVESSPEAAPGSVIVYNDRPIATIRDGLTFNSPRDLSVPLFGMDPESVAGTITATLWDTTHTVFSNDALPTSIDFNRFDVREFSYFHSYLETGRSFTLGGVITSASMVPETGTSAMLLAGLAGLIARRLLARKQ